MLKKQHIDDKERYMVDSTTKPSNSKAKAADNAKDRALDSMLSQIERQFGKGSCGWETARQRK